jgi:hypothetical protein
MTVKNYQLKKYLAEHIRHFFIANMKILHVWTCSNGTIWQEEVQTLSLTLHMGNFGNYTGITSTCVPQQIFTSNLLGIVLQKYILTRTHGLRLAVDRYLSVKSCPSICSRASLRSGFRNCFSTRWANTWDILSSICN